MDIKKSARLIRPVDYSDYYTGGDMESELVKAGVPATMLAQDDENLDSLNLTAGNFLLTHCLFEWRDKEYCVTAEQTDENDTIYIADFLDALDEDEFKDLWDNNEARKAIAALMRYPGHMHEWLMIATLPTLKSMDIGFDWVKEVRTEITTDFEFVSEGQICTHGNNRGSVLMHRDLKKAIEYFAKKYSEKLQRFENPEKEEDEGLIPPDPYEYLKEALRSIVNQYSIDLNSDPLNALKNFLT